MPTYKLHQDHQRPVITLHINKQPHLFLIDTGATHTMLSPSLIPDLSQDQRQTIQAIPADGLGGTVGVCRIAVRFNLLGVSLHEVIFTEEAGDRRRVSGLIGQDVLQKFSRVIIDNRQKTICFEL